MKLIAYMVFFSMLTDAALDAVAERCPRTEEELLAVPGIGPGKMASFGQELLTLLDDHSGK